MTSVAQTEVPTNLVDVGDPPVTPNVTRLTKPTAGIVAMKIVYTILGTAFVGAVGIGLYMWLEIVWLTIVVWVVAVLVLVMGLIGAFKDLIAQCPYCGKLIGTEPDDDLSISQEPKALRCRHCSEYLLVQNGEVRAHDPNGFDPNGTFESVCFKDNVWPRGCVVCGAWPTRYEHVYAGKLNAGALLVGQVSTSRGDVAGVPHCDQHKDGVALKIVDDKLRLRWQSLRMMRRYLAANRSRSA